MWKKESASPAKSVAVPFHSQPTSAGGQKAVSHTIESVHHLDIEQAVDIKKAEILEEIYADMNIMASAHAHVSIQRQMNIIILRYTEVQLLLSSVLRKVSRNSFVDSIAVHGFKQIADITDPNLAMSSSAKIPIVSTIVDGFMDYLVAPFLQPQEDPPSLPSSSELSTSTHDSDNDFFMRLPRMFSSDTDMTGPIDEIDELYEQSVDIGSSTREHDFPIPDSPHIAHNTLRHTIKGTSLYEEPPRRAIYLVIKLDLDFVRKNVTSTASEHEKKEICDAISSARIKKNDSHIGSCYAKFATEFSKCRKELFSVARTRFFDPKAYAFSDLYRSSINLIDVMRSIAQERDSARRTELRQAKKISLATSQMSSGMSQPETKSDITLLQSQHETTRAGGATRKRKAETENPALGNDLILSTLTTNVVKYRIGSLLTAIEKHVVEHPFDDPIIKLCILPAPVVLANTSPDFWCPGNAIFGLTSFGNEIVKRALEDIISHLLINFTDPGLVPHLLECCRIGYQQSLHDIAVLPQTFQELFPMIFGLDPVSKSKIQLKFHSLLILNPPTINLHHLEYILKKTTVDNQRFLSRWTFQTVSQADTMGSIAGVLFTVTLIEEVTTEDIRIDSTNAAKMALGYPASSQQNRYNSNGSRSFTVRRERPSELKRARYHESAPTSSAISIPIHTQPSITQSHLYLDGRK